jgi:hypothetical protein
VFIQLRLEAGGGPFVNAIMKFKLFKRMFFPVQLLPAFLLSYCRHDSNGL